MNDSQDVVVAYVDPRAAGEERLSPFIEKIRNADLRRFVRYCIDRLPHYFWTLPASTSGRRHGVGESLIDHVVGCLQLADGVCEQMHDVWRQSEADQLFAALILHDGWRCGQPGSERRYPAEHDLTGQLRSDPSHPEVGYERILHLYQQFVCRTGGVREDELPELARSVAVVADAVRFHYGPWTENKSVTFDVTAPYSSVVVQVHNIDYMHAMSSRIRSAA